MINSSAQLGTSSRCMSDAISTYTVYIYTYSCLFFTHDFSCTPSNKIQVQLRATPNCAPVISMPSSKRSFLVATLVADRDRTWWKRSAKWRRWKPPWLMGNNALESRAKMKPPKNARLWRSIIHCLGDGYSIHIWFYPYLAKIQDPRVIEMAWNI